MTRRLSVLVFLAVLATVGTGALLIARERARTEPEVTPPVASGLALITVRTGGGSVPVVVGSTGFGTSGALVVPPAAPATFSCRWSSDDVPGISSMLGERCSSHASATDITVAPSSSATVDSADDWSGVNPPSGKYGT